jgi:hypothetical protein
MISKENIFLFFTWFVLYLIYYFLLCKMVSIQNLLIVSFVSMIFFKSIYDVINKTGYKKMYSFNDENLNQYLRYIVAIISLFIAIFYNYALLCKFLKLCGS